MHGIIGRCNYFCCSFYWNFCGSIVRKGYESADDWAALFASGFILFNAYLIFRPALGEIMDEHVHDDLIEKIRATSNQVEGIIDTEKCFIRKAGMKYHVDLHAIVNAMITVKEGHDLAHKLKDRLHKELPELGHVLIHVEPEGE
jgi:divalent metal cation (Fe/Co/Zn/Cd) transporter